MFTYDLMSKFYHGNSNADGVTLRDLAEQSGDAVVAVFPILDADSFNFANSVSNLSLSQGAGKKKNNMVAGGPYLLDDELLFLQINQNKSSHVGMLNSFLKDPDGVALKRLSPGDWIVAWMFDNKMDGDLLRARLNNGRLKAENGFRSGLKFVGKIFSVRANVQIAANGVLTRGVNVVASMFSEFDTSIYYDPMTVVSLANGLSFSMSINKYIMGKTGLPESVNSWVGGSLLAFLGDPPQADTSAFEDFHNQTAPVHTPSVQKKEKILRNNWNQALGVPEQVATLLGCRGNKYLNILEAYVGVQKYESNDVNGYVPVISNKKKVKGVVYNTSQPLLGFISPYVEPFNNVPIWGILQKFCIPVVNEMYTTLRWNPWGGDEESEGGILPTFIARQIPFNTNAYKERTSHSVSVGPVPEPGTINVGTANKSKAKNAKFQLTSQPYDNSPPQAQASVSVPKTYPVTRFLELPRWKISNELLASFDFGKSDALRINFVQIQPVDVNIGQTIAQVLRSTADPIVDEVDVNRNGLRPFIAPVNAVFATAENANFMEIAQIWGSIVTDRLMGSHLKLTGTMNTIGIQEPICVGDNLEYDGLVFHLESVTHKLEVNPNTGFKSFSTQLSLSNGVPATGLVLPEIEVRQIEKVAQGKGNKKILFKEVGRSSVGLQKIPNASEDKDIV